MIYFTAVLKGQNGNVNVEFRLTDAYPDTTTDQEALDQAMIFLLKVAKKETKGNFIFSSVDHDAVPLSKYNLLVKGIIEREPVEDIELTPEEIPTDEPTE